MKAFIAAAAFAAVARAGWEDAKPVDPATTTPDAAKTWLDVPVKETSTTPYDPAHTWEDAPVDPTTTASWEDEPVDGEEDEDCTETPVTETSTSTVYTWADAAKPVDPTATATWEDAPVDPAAATTWADAPVSPASTDACSVVTVTKTGEYIWVPVADASVDPTWADAPVDPTTAATWEDAPVDPTTAATWEDNKPVDPTSTTSAGWADQTTVAPTSSKPAKPTWTTSAGPPPVYGAKCPADNGKTLKAGGSCGCEYKINCGVKASPGKDSKFWQKNPGQLVDTLDACNKLCDENAACESTLWVDTKGTADYHLCWQTSKLGPVTGTGYAQISYKGKCSGKCAANYSK